MMHQVAKDIEQQRARPQIQTDSSYAVAGCTYVTTLYVTNVHCQSCVSYAKEVLQSIEGVTKVHISIADHSVRVEHQGDVGDKITKELTAAAFEVRHFETSDLKGVIVREKTAKSPTWRLSTLSKSEAQSRHAEKCNACRAESVHNKEVRKGKLSGLFQQKRQSRKSAAQCSNNVDESAEMGPENPAIIDVNQGIQELWQQPKDDVFKAMISIGGMTCASCVSTITKELETLDNVRSVVVSLLANNAIVKFDGPKEKVDTIIKAIEGVGYEATLDELIATTSPERDSVQHKFQATLSLEGMTCGSCVGTITRGLQELPFVSNVQINLIGNSGVVVFVDKNNLEILLEKIDDLGYHATVIKLESKDVPVMEDGRPAERTVKIAIKGMYCQHCPAQIMKEFLEAVGDSILINQEPTLEDPRLGLTYMPHPPELTIRRFISIVNSTHEAFSAMVDRPQSIEERSRAVQHREQRRILLRLLFTFCVAIPTIIIGIIYMSLVPTTNITRIWFEQAIWAGQASRAEWALFILTTPVMFFGADLFHVKAYKELRSLWRPGSKVPILRRFYRFGSMNLLISAGTSVAYFSSLAVLILDATSRSNPMKGGGGNGTYFDSVTFLSFFILIGRFLEAYSKAKTGDAVATLSNLRPSEAVLVETADKESGEEVTTTHVSVDLLEVGDLINVMYGTSPPTDGTINQLGDFLFDESSLTGESKPVKKVSGDKVFAGSVNISHPVRVKVTEIGGTSMLDQIVAVVREGQTKRAPIERIADFITGYFVPVITLIAVVTFLVWFGLGQSGALPKRWLNTSQGGWAFWSVEFAISVFVVACPCGIALAAPTALFVGGGLAARYGILVQGGGEAFQEASKLDVIVFDKTGTLTEGKMKVTECESLSMGADEAKQNELSVSFALARVLEESSTHPIAKAIVDFCTESQQRLNSENIVIDARVEEIPGKGMRGVFKLRSSASTSDHDMTYEAGIGNQALFPVADNMQNSNYFLDSTLGKFQNFGHSTAIFSLRRLLDDAFDDEEQLQSEESRKAIRPTLVFAISDPLRPTTANVLRSLQAGHNISIHMCTGDNEITARAVASQIGIPVSQIRAGVLPQDKAAYIQELQHLDGKRRAVAFVGDGTNDAAALAAADVSIALSSGSDVAINAASFILLNSDLQTVLELIRLAKRVFWRVKANFVWAAVYNVALVPVAAGVFYPIGRHWRLGPVWSSAAMAASSMSVVMSSLALKLPEVRWKRRN